MQSPAVASLRPLPRRGTSGQRPTKARSPSPQEQVRAEVGRGPAGKSLNFKWKFFGQGDHWGDVRRSTDCTEGVFNDEHDPGTPVLHCLLVLIPCG